VTAIAAIEYLQSAAGEEQLRAVAEFDLSDNALLREITRLRKKLSAEQAAAVMEQAALRRRAAAKFSRAAEMLFTPDGLEQSSGELLAGHSAGRFSGFSRVGDLCCGIGGDTLALALHARVASFDNDPVCVACAGHNARIYGLETRIELQLADVQEINTSALHQKSIDAIFFDPSRRSEGRRIYSIDAYHPPVTLIDRWLPEIPAIGVKIAPGVEREQVRWECEQEFVAAGSDLKECLLWFGPLAQTTHRATVLPAVATLVKQQPGPTAVGEPAAWLYDPSPAVTRAGLVAELAQLLGARQLDERLAYLTGTQLVETPLARVYAIESWQSFGLKRLQAHLRSLEVGRVEVHRRGAPIEPAELERRLHLEGKSFRLVFVTRLRGRLISIICHPPAH
jgi:THUMP domain-like/RNA cap guanine-N2 methyltransferase